jgi:hypothetical protein
MKKRYPTSLLIFLFSAASFADLKAQRPDGSDGIWTRGARYGLEQTQKQTITTSFEDADTTYVFPETFGDSIQSIPLNTMPRNASGAYILKPGFYKMVCKSYCIKAGTYGPSKGDAYLLAPLRGPKESLMREILISAEKKPVMQQDVQLLFWAIISKTKFSDFNPRMKLVAATLLTPKQLLEFDGGAIGFIPKPIIENAVQSLPIGIQKVIRAENEMRRLFTNVNSTYEEFERLAVLTGAAPIDRPAFRRGRWCQNPEGYYIRYRPSGYSNTDVQIFVPERPFNKPKPVGETTQEIPWEVFFNAIGTVAVPSNTGSQRLLQSNEVFQNNR